MILENAKSMFKGAWIPIFRPFPYTCNSKILRLLEHLRNKVCKEVWRPCSSNKFLELIPLKRHWCYVTVTDRNSMRKLTPRPVNCKGKILWQLENLIFYEDLYMPGIVLKHNWMAKLVLPIQLCLISNGHTHTFFWAIYMLVWMFAC